MRTVLATMLVSILITGCAVVTVVDAAATVAGAAVDVGATVVETTVDVAAAGVKAVAHSASDKK